MLSTFAVVLLGAGTALGATSYASRVTQTEVEPTLTEIEGTAATATPLSPSSNVKGLAFDRFFQVWLENTDYSSASGDPNQKYLASQGITLTNYWATTHPSEPNYCAVVAGENFGMDNDDFNALPPNVSTVVDLLDTKGISWAEYQEDLPYPGFQGFNFSNQKTFNNDYVRKHDPLILFESVTLNATRLGLIKNFTTFNDDLQKQQLPQWAFVTPNMTDDGHDTNVSFASKWERGWLAPLLNNPYFMENTLILLTFDENESKTKPNKPYAILLGGAVHDSLKGTTDNTFYNHYSTISSVSVNWGLPSLGRWDCNANVFQIVANKTGYVNYDVDTTNLFFNASYPGPLSDDKYIPIWPAPDTTAKCAAGKGVLQAVVGTWSQSTPTYNYSSPYPYDAANGINIAGSATRPGSSSASSSPSSSGSGSGSGSSSSSSPTATGGSTASATSSSASASSSSSAASPFTSISTSLLGFLTGLAAFII